MQPRKLFTCTLALAIPASTMNLPVRNTQQNTADMVECYAARTRNMSEPEIFSTLYALDKWDGNDWRGKTLPYERKLFFLRQGWKSSEQCYNDCAHRCLMPAASYGFDAAYCHLLSGDYEIMGIGATGLTHQHCIAGYTPHPEGVCVREKDNACPYTMADLREYLRDKSGYHLRNLRALWSLEGMWNSNWQWRRYFPRSPNPTPQWNQEIPWPITIPTDEGEEWSK